MSVNISYLKKYKRYNNGAGMWNFTEKCIQGCSLENGKEMCYPMLCGVDEETYIEICKTRKKHKQKSNERLIIPII